MTVLRRTLVLTFALILALTSQGLAIARGQGMAAGYIVICVGGGFATMPVGPDGQPVGPAHFCPDGVLAVAGAAPAPALAAPAMRLAAVVVPVPVVPPVPAVFHPVPAARGPPALS